MSEWRILDETGASFVARWLKQHERLHEVLNWRPKTVWLPPRDYLHQIHENPDAQMAEANRLRAECAVEESGWVRPRWFGAGDTDTPFLHGGVDGIYDELRTRSAPEVKAGAAEMMLNRPLEFLANRHAQLALPGKGKSKAARKIWRKWAKKSGFKIEKLKLKKESK